MKLLIAAAILIIFGCGWLAGTSYVYSAQMPDEDQCERITNVLELDLSRDREAIRLENGKWCIR